MASEPNTLTAPSTHVWDWCGQRIGWLHAGSASAARAVVLIHGFGANSRHWRHNIPVLAGAAEVFAIDLLGFGSSAKPPSTLPGEVPSNGAVFYGFDLWSELVADFIVAQVSGHQPDRPVILVGNSIGGVVALATARRLSRAGAPSKLQQVILIDCAQRALDEKRVQDLPLLQRLNRPLLKRLVRQRWLTQSLFRVLARPGFIRRVLNVAYPTGANVDDELVALLYGPTTDPGAPESFRGFVNLFSDWLAPDLLAELNLPVRMIWGGRDPWESPQEAERWVQRFAIIQELRVLDGLGHCPHDEAPERVNPILVQWLQAG